MQLVLSIPALSIATKPCMWCTWNLTVDRCEYFDFTVWICLSIIILWRIISIEMIRFRAIVSICWEGGRKEGNETALQYMNAADLCLHLSGITYVHLLSFTPRASLPAWLNQISLRNQCRTSYRTCKTWFPTSFGW